jgi:uncharacterized protein YceK
MRNILVSFGVLLILASCSSTSAVVSYKNCAEAKKAGVAPLRAGDEGYRTGLDRDGDGIACDN